MSTAARPHTLGTRPGWAAEYEAILDAYRQAGGDPGALTPPDVAVLVVSANRVLANYSVEGVTFEAVELPNGVRARIAVASHVRVARPVHLCFGMLPAEGLQEIIAHAQITRPDRLLCRHTAA